MSRNFDAAGQTPSRKNNRRKAEARRGSLGRLLPSLGNSDVRLELVLEGLENRQLMAAMIELQGSSGQDFTTIYDEGSTPVAIATPNATVTTDNNNTDLITAASITIANPAEAADETLAVTIPTADAGLVTAADQGNSVVLTPTSPNGVASSVIQSIFQSATYIDSKPDPTNTPARTIHFDVTETGGETAEATATVNVDDVPPTIELAGVNGQGFTATYDEGHAAVPIAGQSNAPNNGAATVTLTNDANYMVTAASITIANPAEAADETLAVTIPTADAGLVTAADQGNSVVLTPTSPNGVASSVIQSIFQSATYIDSKPDPTNTPARTIHFDVTETGGETAEATATVNVDDVPPTIELAGVNGQGFAAGFLEGLGAIPIAGTSTAGNDAATVTTPNASYDITNASITLTNDPDGSLEVLGVTIPTAYASNVTPSLTTMGGERVLTLTMNPATGVPASVIESIFQTATYDDSSSTPTTSARQIVFSVTQTGGETGSADTTVDFAPLISAPTSPQSHDQGQANTLTFDSTNNNLISVADAALGTNERVKVSLQVSQGTLTLKQTTNLAIISGGNGTNDASLVFTGYVADVNAALNGLVYTPASNSLTSDSLVVLVSDQGQNSLGTPLSSKATIPINVTAVANLGFTATTPIDETGGTNYLARRPLTYKFTITNQGPSAATDVDFHVAFNLSELSTDFQFNAFSVTDPNNSNNPIPFTITQDPSTPGIFDIVLTNPLADSASANVSFTVTTVYGGSLAYTASLSEDQVQTAPALPLSNAVTVQDSGYFYFDNGQNGTTFTDSVEIPGANPSSPTYTDYYVTIRRSQPTAPAGSSPAPSPLEPAAIANFTINGNAIIGQDSPTTDYEILTDQGTYTSNSDPGNTTFPVSFASNVTSEEITIRVFDQFIIPPIPDRIINLALQPSEGDSLLPTPPTPESATVTLKHPVLTVNNFSDQPIFEPTSNNYTLRGIVDELNDFAQQGLYKASYGPIPITFDFTDGGIDSPEATINLLTPLDIQIPVSLIGPVNSQGQPDITIQPSTNPSFLPDSVDGDLNGLNFTSTTTSGAGSTTVYSNGSVVEGLDITGFKGAGINLEAGSNDVTLEGNTILANSVGVMLISSNDTIGGTLGSARNVISGNNTDGIDIDGSSSDLIEGNYIGTDVAGASALPNAIGIFIDGTNTNISQFNTIGGTNSGARNLISGNANSTVVTLNGVATTTQDGTGIEIDGSGATSTLIAGNYIGTNVTGLNAISGQTYGIELEDGASGATIGGTLAGSANVISGNLGSLTVTDSMKHSTTTSTIGAGIQIEGTGATNTMVEGNFIGTNAAGTGSPTPIPNYVGIDIEGTALSNTIGGTTSGAGNVVSGNSTAGILIQGSGATGQLLEGNRIGTDSAGATNLTGQAYGIELVDATSGTIGGSVAGSGNVISGNTIDGIWLNGSSYLSVSGNEIGTNAAGTLAVPNGTGVFIDGTSGPAELNTIGGTTALARNVISGNTDSGIFVTGSSATQERVEGNFIGTDALGGQALSGQSNGITFSKVSSGTIGGSVAGSGNVISGNTTTGISLDSASKIDVIGNAIGTNADGSGAVANNIGIYIIGAGSNTIGGVVSSSSSGARNVISGNITGILIYGAEASSELVEGNYIGTDASGSRGLGNQSNGIVTYGVTGGTIGGTSPGAGNVISGNTSSGIYLESSSNVSIERNFIGTDDSSSTPVPNLYGIFIGNGDAGNNTIGGTSPSLGNVISGNLQTGIHVNVASTLPDYIESNYIGTNDSFSPNISGLGNAGDGIFVGNADGSLTTAAGSGGVVITGNAIDSNLGNGIDVQGGFNENIQGNFIGTDFFNQTIPLGNQGNGILVNGDNQSLYGIDTNLIVNNGQSGVEVEGAVGGLSLISNTIGGATGANKQDGVLISATLASSATATVLLELNMIDQNGENGVELAGAQHVLVGSNTPSGQFIGNTISDNTSNGVEVDSGSSNNFLVGDTIGSNHQNGVQITESSESNVINGGTINGSLSNGIDILGGSSSNLVSSVTIINSKDNGILIDGANSNTLTGNTIGGLDLANQNNGISILDKAADNTVEDNSITYNNNFGLQIAQSTGSTISRNTISNNHSTGVVISGSSLANTLVSNTIGGNSLAGVLVVGSQDNTIGGTTATGSANTIESNQTDGIEIFSGSSSNFILGNVISSNVDDGINIEDSNQSSVHNNTISKNSGDGVHLADAGSNTIGGTSSGNTIAANNQSGIEIFGDSDGNKVLDNVIGTLQDDISQGNKLDGVLISGSVATNINGVTASPTDPQDNTVQGNFISGNQANGVAIDLADSNTVSTNYFGIYSGISNSLSGIDIVSSASSIVEDNIISHDGVNGISLESASGTTIDGNTINTNLVDGISLDSTSGTSINQNTIMGDQADGIRIANDSMNNGIGVGSGTEFSPGNMILGNLGAGVEVSTGSTCNFLQNNMIGLVTSSVVDTQGDVITPGMIDGNGVGVFLNEVSGNYVGNESESEGNTITGNSVAGVYISGNSQNSPKSGNTVAGNRIGTDSNGNSPGVFPTTNFLDSGVYVFNSTNNTIGGLTTASGNLISGNHSAGIDLFGANSTSNFVLFNTVGPDQTLTQPITFPGFSAQRYAATLPTTDPNYVPTRQTYGIEISGAPSNYIYENYVLANQIGVDIQGSTATGNLIQGNTVGDPTYVPGLPSGSPPTGLQNFDGIFIDNTSSNTIGGSTIGGTTLSATNEIQGNISIGVGMVGAAANDNTVANNLIKNTGGLADPNVYKNAGPGSILLISYSAANSNSYTAGPVKEFGNGVYIDASNANLVTNNTIQDSAVAGIYVLQDGTTLSNSIYSNSIADADHNYLNGGPYIGDYGVLLFDSSGDLSNFATPTSPTGVVLSGTEMNHFGVLADGMSSFLIAPFHEYTGNAKITPPAIYTPPNPTVSSSKVKATSVKIAAVSQSIKVTTGKKGLPLPPVMNSLSRRK